MQFAGGSDGAGELHRSFIGQKAPSSGGQSEWLTTEG